MSTHPLLRTALSFLAATGLASAFAPALAAADCPRGTTVLRLFVDLQCPHCRRAWPDTVRAASEAPCVRVELQQLPNSAHPQATWAAQVALAARDQGKELAFVDAVFAAGAADRPAVEKALGLVGLDAAKTLAAAAGLGALVAAEKQSALAFGVRATPSALINGKGVAGGLSYATLRDALAVAAHQTAALASEFGATVDVERARLLIEAPEFVPAYDAMLRARGRRAEPAATGALGTRWRVGVKAADVLAGPANATATLVVFASPNVAWTVAQVPDLLALASPELRVAVQWLAEPSGGQAGAAMAGSLLAVAHRAPDRLHRLIGLWKRAVAPTADEVSRLVASEPPQLANELQGAATSGETAARLSAYLDQARRVDAGAGAIFINGRRWIGAAGDAGLREALQAAVREAREHPAAQRQPGRGYDAIVADGRWRSDADLVFGSQQPVGDVAALPALGASGAEVLLLGEFSQPATRAAWYMLRRLARPGPRAITLRFAPSGGSPAAVRIREAYLAAAVAGSGDKAAETLFAASDPGDKAVLAKVAGAAKSSDKAVAALDAVARLRRCCAWGEEPVIAVRGRAYLGALDETRLGEAIAALAATK